jgi:putative tricarboxylic transport membrane protein
MWEMITAGFAGVFNLQCLLLIVGGVALGIIFGSIPGLSANMAVALCLPISFGMDPIPGITLLVALYIGGISGGLISAILINIPGTPASIATCFDGSPMAKNGEAGKALGTGVITSFLGGLFSIGILICIAPTIARIALKFGPFEYAAVGIFSLTLISSLISGSVIKGLIGGFLGVMLATFGAAPVDNFPRFTFGFHELDAGFNVLTVLIGLFAVAEVLKTAAAQTGTSGEVVSYKMPGPISILKELFSRQKLNMLRSAVIGTAIGILPGLGGSTANIISYATAKNQSKYPEKFGTGIVDGVVASETSNNATIGGALIPLLTMGIPGDVVTAMLLGGLMIHGMTPGPLLFTTDAKFVYGIFAALLIANFIMALMMLGGMRFFVKVLNIPKQILLPVVMVLCMVGAFALNNRIFDVWCVLIFGVLGYLLDKVKIPLPPVVMGFILGPIVELNLRRGLMASAGSFLPLVTRPISLTFLLVAAVSLAFTVRKNLKGKQKTNAC